MKIVYDIKKDKHYEHEDLIFLDIDQCFYIKIDENNINFITERESFINIGFNYEYSAKCVLEYILSAMHQGIEVLNITEFALEKIKEGKLIEESVKAREQIMEKRKNMARNGLSLPEYEFKEGALSMYHKDNDEGKLSLED